MNKNGFFKCGNCGHYQHTTDFWECEECGYEDLAEITEEEYAAWFSREVKQDHKTKLLTAKQANLMFEALENVRLKSLL